MASVSKNRQGKWSVYWRDANKRTHSKVIPGPKGNALKVKADIEARQALGHLYEAEPETLGVYLEGWLTERYGLQVRASTSQRRREALRALGALVELTPHGGETVSRRAHNPEIAGSTPARATSLAAEYLPNITAVQVEDAVYALAARPAPRQAQLALASLKLALRDAETRGQRFDSRIFNVKPPRYTPKPRRFLSWDEVVRLASWLPEHLKRVVPVAALTGLRQGEIFALLEDDLDLTAGLLYVRRSGDGPTKTEASERIVHLPPLAVELLREQLLARRHTEDRFVFPAFEGGMQIADNFMERQYRKAVVRAGLGRFFRDEDGVRHYEGPDFHTLRHTYVSLAALSGARPEHIAAQLGHADGGSLLLRTYRHLFPNELQETALKLEALVRPATASVEEGKAGA